MKLIYSIHKCDVFMFTWLNNVSIHTHLVRLCRYISKTGDGILYVLAAAWLYWESGSESPLFKAMALAFLIERPIYFILKNSFKRNRPQAALENFRSVIIPSDRFSFPSGHTSAAFMMATLVGFFIPVLVIPLYLWAASVGFSRVVLGVHFPTDTLMGAAIGVGTAIFSLDYLLSL
ncbi:MAG TPA: phosphatase PAP2 family protein [Methylococcaceae bacterium]|nr:phosphatase PAP2 family protein [Methylococcaceae bacterium]